MIAVEVLRDGQIKDTVNVDHEVFRIGGDPKSSIRIDECEPHALTVVTRNGHSRVINRSSEPVLLPGGALGPQQTAEWLPGQQLDIDGAASLRLRGEGRQQSRRARRRAEAKAQAKAVETEQNAAADTGKEKKNTTLLACVTVMMMVVFLALAGSGVGIDSRAEFENLVVNLSNAENPRILHARSLIQQGRAFELRGMNDRAAAEYGKAVEVLRASPGTVGPSDDGSGAFFLQQTTRYAEGAHVRVLQ